VIFWSSPERPEVLSIFDSTSAESNSGDFSDLAARATKPSGNVAVTTSVYDSDSFEFVIYRSGKQVDAIVSDAIASEGTFTILSEKQRVRKWREWFQLTLDAASIQRRLQLILTGDWVFAEDVIAQLADLVGIDPTIQTASYTDLLAANSTAITRLYFERKADSTAAPVAGTPELSFYLSEDDCPYHCLYPAAWPVPVNESTPFSWLITSSGAGFTELRVSVLPDGIPASRLENISLQAFPFYNGQITSMTPLASQTITPSTSPEGVIAHFSEFKIPDGVPESKKKVILILTLQIHCTGTDTITITPEVEAAGRTTSLPALRLIVVEPDWIPLVSGLHPTFTVKTFPEESEQERVIEMGRSSKMRQVLLLNSPGVATGGAVFRSNTQDVLGSARAFVAARLQTITNPSCIVRVVLHKHMTAAGSISKTKKEFPPEALLKDSFWKRMFLFDRRYQTIKIDLLHPEFTHPLAGFVIQHPLEMDSLASRATPAPEPTLHFSQWIINHTECESLLGISIEAWQERFADWIDGSEVLQGWQTLSTWIPLFDMYENYQVTLYEESSLFSWFYSGVHMEKMYRDWCSSHLRFVAPTLWLSDELLSQVDQGVLAQYSENFPIRAGKKIVKKPTATLEDIERTLLPILPIESERWAADG
jgi:hypothetical protein